jgi:hypothetical protein
MRTERRKRPSEAAVIDLTPMIDVTFQLLIFFIICTRFSSLEDKMLVELPKDQGPKSHPTPPKEQLTIYCAWDETTEGNSYVVGMDARGRRPVDGSFARLDEMVIYPTDSQAQCQVKRARYKVVFDNLVAALENYAARSGANIEKVEIAFARDSRIGAASGTVPWIFVSTALDATAKANLNRKKAGLALWAITFKFTDALGVYR